LGAGSDSEVATNALTLVRASDDTGNTADAVTRSIRRTPGVISNVTTISTIDLADPNGGIELLASASNRARASPSQAYATA
jgi:hypothetical protein